MGDIKERKHGDEYVLLLVQNLFAVLVLSKGIKGIDFCNYVFVEAKVVLLLIVSEMLESKIIGRIFRMCFHCTFRFELFACLILLHSVSHQSSHAPFLSADSIASSSLLSN